VSCQGLLYPIGEEAQNFELLSEFEATKLVRPTTRRPSEIREKVGARIDPSLENLDPTPHSEILCVVVAHRNGTASTFITKNYGNAGITDQMIEKKHQSVNHPHRNYPKQMSDPRFVS